MDPLSVAGSIAGLVTLVDAVFRGVYKYYQAASDADKEIKELANQLQSFAGILHGLGLLASTLEQNGTHTTLQMTHISDATKLIGEIQARLDKPMSRIHGSKMDNVQQSLKWPFTKTRTKTLSDSLIQQQQIVGLALQADSLGNLVKLLSNDEEIKKGLSSVQTGVENLQMLTRVEVNGERQRILDFFLKVNPQPNLDTSRRLRHPGTGTWLTESLQFQQWIEIPGSRLWLSGIPGAGKTVLAGAVIQKALERGKNSPRVGVAFFFCDYKDEKATSLSTILGAMASQLSRQNENAFDELKKLYELLHPSDGLTRDPDSDLLQDCLEEIFKYFDQIILVIDGLDECGDNTDEVTEALANVANCSDNVTVALASRDEYNIDLKLRDSFPRVPIGARKEDILLYVGSEIDKRVKDGRLRTSNVNIKDEILKRLSEDADGMYVTEKQSETEPRSSYTDTVLRFRWVACQLDYICGCPTDADRRAALKELPPTLDATYERMLRRVHSGHPRARNIVLKCLHLLSVKWFQWNMNSLRHAISVPDTPNVTLDESAVVTEAEISLLCSSFIRKSDDGRTFEFSHFTVREFLERETLLQDHELASYHLSETVCNATLCQQSLRYLQLRNFDHTSSLGKNDHLPRALQQRQAFPFYAEATFAWIFALRRAPQRPGNLELARCLFDPCKSPSFITWAVQLCGRLIALVKDARWQDGESPSLRATSMVMDPSFRPIHLASALDLPEICEYLLDVDPKWNIVSRAGSPLEFSIGGSFSFIGFNPPEMRRTTLNWVGRLGYATHRQGQVTTMLKAAGCVIQDPPKQVGGRSLMEGAILSATASLDFSPISSLISMRWTISEAEAELFVWGMGFIVQSYPHEYFNGPSTLRPRLTASFLDLITSLNKSCISRSDHGFKMCAAAWNAAVKLECDFINDINLMDTRITLSYGALISKCAVAIMNEDVEQMQRCLRDRRITGPEAGDNGTDGCGYRLLRRAIAENSVKVARLLINSGYSPTKPFLDGALPIHGAWCCGEDMFRLLLESGASHLDRDADGNNIWHLAALRSQHGTLSALLNLIGEERSKALRMQNAQGFTPLTLALHMYVERLKILKNPDEKGDETAAIDLLLDACGYEASCWQCVGSPWHLAAQSGSLVAIEYLKESGVPLDPIQEGQCTPLHALNSLTSEECVELLKEIFPTATSILYQSQTPLERFIYHCFCQPSVSRVPKPGVIETLADTGTPDSTIQAYCALWRYFCKDILGHTPIFITVDYPLFLGITLKIYLSPAIKAYEELKGQSAILPFFSGVQNSCLGWIHDRDIEIVISRTGFWSSACVATETIEYVKYLIRQIASGNRDEVILANSIHILLDKGVNPNLFSGSSSIMEEACQRLACGERDIPNSGPIALRYKVQRGVFADIVDHANLEQLSAPQPANYRYLEILARKGCDYGSLWMIDTLVSKGLNPNKVRLGATEEPLLVRCLNYKATWASLLLLERGADPKLRSSNHTLTFNALHAAAIRGQIHFLESLWSKFGKGLVEFPWEASASLWIAIGQLQKVFPSVNALHLAAFGGHHSSLQFLIGNDVLSDAKSTASEGYNCLHFAAISGSKQTIEHLYSLGLDINQPADDGSLPIHLAVKCNKLDAVRALMELSSATYADDLGMTPEMYAEKFSYTEIRDLLRTSQRNAQAYTTAHNKRGRNGGVKLLLKTLESAITKNDLETCNILYDQDIPLYMPMPSCGACSPLILAMRLENREIIRWLLERRASVLGLACLKHGGVSTLELVVQRKRLTQYLWQILNICLETAWDLESLGSPIFRAANSRNHASLSLIVKHIRQNTGRYRYVPLTHGT